MWFCSVVVALVIILTVSYYRTTPCQPICGIYHKPGRFFLIKYWIFRSILYLNNKRSGKDEFSSLGRLPQAVDKAQVLSDSIKAFDAVFFMAISQNGFYIVAGSERRKHNTVNGLFYIAVPGIGLLCSHKIPDTVLFDAEDDTFGAEGILLQPVEPMKKWKISYTGEMWLHINPTKQLMVTFNGTWTSKLPIFNFDTDLDPGCVASAMANEPWSLQYFQMLKK